jgi:hypothetical protein
LEGEEENGDFCLRLLRQAVHSTILLSLESQLDTADVVAADELLQVHKKQNTLDN